MEKVQQQNKEHSVYMCSSLAADTRCKIQDTFNNSQMHFQQMC